MKKFLTMAAVALFMMTSCSDDDSTSNDNPTTVVLLKKTIETDEFGEEWTTNYFYEGTKLVKMSDPDGEQKFFYTGDLLTKMTYSGDGLEQTDIFTYYPDNTIKTHLMLTTDMGEEYGSKYEFTHNADGTITKKYYYGDHTSQTELGNTYVLTMTNGNITNVKDTSSHGSITNTSYTFDNKNEPRKNITGYASMILAADNEGGVNNILTGSVYGESAYTYTYNSDDYPVTSKETITYGTDTEVYTTKYFYE